MASDVEGAKQLVFLWYTLHPDDTYLSFCVGMSKDIDDLPAQMRTYEDYAKGVLTLERYQKMSAK